MFHITLNAHLLSGQASYRSAGIHGYIKNTLAHLPAADPDLRYDVFVGQGQPPSHKHMNVHRSRLATQRPQARILWEQFVQPFALARKDADLHHGLAFALPLLWRGPSVVTVYDLSFMRYANHFQAANRLYLTTMTRLACRRARRVIAISQSTRSEIETLLGIPARRIDVALPGVAPHFRPLSQSAVDAFRRSKNLPQRLILYVGTHEPRKNLDTLLRAVAELPQQDTALALIGGRGWLYQSIDATIQELGLGKRVIRPGYIADELLPLWYNAAAVFAYPSAYEGFGLPLLEAMACGTPVVAADTTSLPEATGREAAGLLLPPDDISAWSHALSDLLDDNERRHMMTTMGIERAATFSWAETARQTVTSYHRALNNE